MAVPRARLRGPFGGPSMVPRNELAIDPILDAVSRGATGLIQNAYLRKRQKNQDAMAEQQRVEAANLAAQDRAERRETAQRDYDLRLRTFESGEQRERDRLQFERDKLAQPKEPNYRQMTDPVKGDVYNIDQGGVASPVMTREGQPFRLNVPKKPGEAGGAAPKTTEGQRKAGGLLLMAQDANRIIDEMAATGKRVPTLAERTGARIGVGVGNYFTTSEYRRMEAAGNRLADAWLRHISGAAVPKDEVEKFTKSFLPVPGDDEETLKDKANSRKLIVDALNTALGKPGDVDTDMEARLQQFLKPPGGQ